MINLMKTLILLAAITGINVSAQTVANDDFNRADGGLGANWTTGADGNAIVANSVKGLYGGPYVNYWTANSFGSNQYSRVTIGALSTGGTYQYAGAVVRATGIIGGRSGYYAWASPDTVTIGRTDLGVDHPLISASGIFADGSTLELRVTNQTFTAFVNDALIVTTNDSTYATGYAGIYIYGLATADDWEGGNFADTIPTNPPAIAVQPISQTLVTNVNGTFGVTASGAPPLVYQWYLDSLVANATNSTFTTNFSPAGSHSVYVIITNLYGSITSSVAMVTVNNGAPPMFVPTNQILLTDVQAAVDAAPEGSTVNIPAGSGIWTNTLIINKSIQLIGAGSSLTFITNNVPRTVNNGQMVVWTTTSNHLARLSGVTFAGGMVDFNAVNFSRSFYVGGTCPAFRIDHCTFTGLTTGHQIEFFGWVRGVVDHCTFYDISTPLMIHQDGYGGHAYGDGSWADSDQWGTTNALYVEDNYFAAKGWGGLNAIDSLDGARIVFRNNFLTNCAVASHGTESGGRDRSFRLMEIYNNQFMASDTPFLSQPIQQAIYLRGGTATIYSNTVVGGYKYMLRASVYRTAPNPFAAFANVTGVNPWDSNNPTLFESGIVSTGIWRSGTSYIVCTNKTWTDNQWVGYIIYDTTQGLGVPISGNSSNQIWFDSSNPYGSSFMMNGGDAYEIRQVVAILDTVGWGQGDLLAGTTPINTATGTAHAPNSIFDPVYCWANTWDYPLGQSYPGAQFNAEGLTLTAGNDPLANNILTNHVRAGYVALVYPHPLVSGTPEPPATNPPAILSQPQGQTVPAGGNINLSVAAIGSNLTYTWELNKVPIVGATNSNMTLSPAEVSYTGNYAVTVSNPFGTVVSAEAAVKVIASSTNSILSPPSGLSVIK